MGASRTRRSSRPGAAPWRCRPAARCARAPACRDTRAGRKREHRRAAAAPGRAGRPGAAAAVRHGRPAAPLTPRRPAAHPPARARHHQQRARQGVRGRQADAGRGEVQVGEVRAAEGAGRDPGDREGDHPVQVAGRGVAAYRAAVPQGDPHTAVGVDAQPVGEARAVLDHGQRTAVRDPAFGRDVEDVDAAGRGVGVVHQRAVGAPAGAVAHRHVVEDGLGAAVAGEPGQRAPARCLVVAHRARPQAAVGGDGGVVAAAAGDGLPVQPAEGVVRVEQADPVPQVEDQAAARAGLDGADVLVGAAQRAPAGGRVKGVDAGVQDVQPQQAARRRVPGGALAEGRRRVRARPVDLLGHHGQRGPHGGEVVLRAALGGQFGELGLQGLAGLQDVRRSTARRRLGRFGRGLWRPDRCRPGWTPGSPRRCRARGSRPGLRGGRLGRWCCSGSSRSARRRPGSAR
ncbi:hypothetical protein SVIOM342S_00875 [Streptomyces violaceorubidus]